MVKKKKKRRKATANAIDFVNAPLIDYKKKSLDDFMKEHKNKRMFLSINGWFFIRIKVLESASENSYENVLIKVIERPEWLNIIHGDFLSWKGTRREWKTAVRGTKLFVNKLTLISSETAMKRIQSSLEERRGNLMVSSGQVKLAKSDIHIMEEVEKTLLKFLPQSQE